MSELPPKAEAKDMTLAAMKRHSNCFHIEILPRVDAAGFLFRLCKMLTIFFDIFYCIIRHAILYY